MYLYLYILVFPAVLEGNSSGNTTAANVLSQLSEQQQKSLRDRAFSWDATFEEQLHANSASIHDFIPNTSSSGSGSSGNNKPTATASTTVSTSASGGVTNNKRKQSEVGADSTSTGTHSNSNNGNASGSGVCSVGLSAGNPVNLTDTASVLLKG